MSTKEIEFKNSYYPCSKCKKYELMQFNGKEFECRKGHTERVHYHLRNCSVLDLYSIIEELLQERGYIEEQKKKYNNGLINVKDLLERI